MKDGYKKVCRDWFTETNNLTHDPVRALAAGVILAGVILVVYSVVWRGEKFDVQTFGIGMASLFAGVGAALGLKKESTHAQGKDDS
ncbi:MAG: hypothetical protein H0Z53_00820 [Nitrosospira sp.]|nr:hypothetical protein [Nitrosospira sp.]